jgi:D-sedoheptulose 7-phosphate isomerase
MKDKILSMVQNHQKCIQHFADNNIETVIRISGLILETFEKGGKVLLCGNGGSMADCQHITGEFVGKYRKVRQPLPAMALSTDSALITCIGNDFSFNDIFSRQVEALGTDKDILWAFSTSGQSANILSAANAAKKKGIKVVAFTGKSDSPLEKICDICLCAHSDKTNHSQEVHELAYHIICEIIDDSIQ